MNANNNTTQNADNTNTISTNKDNINDNNKIRITNFKPSKMIIEEDENEKILDEDFFMIKQPIKIATNTELKKHKRSYSIEHKEKQYDNSTSKSADTTNNTSSS